MIVVRQKAFAYVTNRDRLLVFSHPESPEAGIQVPAGTLERDENPSDGVLRETREETGLASLKVVRYLGTETRDMSDFGRNELHERRFFHLTCQENPPDRWRGYEEYSTDSERPIPLDFFWTTLDEAPELIADHGAMLPELVASLRASIP